MHAKRCGAELRESFKLYDCARPGPTLGICSKHDRLGPSLRICSKHGLPMAHKLCNPHTSEAYMHARAGTCTCID